jgi:hypothetical protein
MQLPDEERKENEMYFCCKAKSFMKTCSSSADTLVQHILVRKGIPKLRGNKDGMQKQHKHSASYEN